jgi:DNA anti-recombination protein RmuC
MSAVNDHPSTLDQPGTPAAAPAGNPDRSASGDLPATGNLEKVRDILFGHQMREVDRRFARLEERILKETRDLKDDVKRRLDALEAYMHKEAEALATQLRNEHGERVDANTRLARELADTTTSFERRTAALDEQLAKGQREIRQHILEQQQRLGDDVRERIDEVFAALARESSELRHNKTDRAALAALLQEMALRLTGEFELPADEDRGNG